MKARGGVYSVAASADLHFTLVYAFLRGATGLRPENLGRLRAVLPEVPDAVWVDIAAPLPQPRPRLRARRERTEPAEPTEAQA